MIGGWQRWSLSEPPCGLGLTSLSRLFGATSSTSSGAAVASIALTTNRPPYGGQLKLTYDTPVLALDRSLNALTVAAGREHSLCASPRMIVLIIPTTDRMADYEPPGYETLIRDDAGLSESVGETIELAARQGKLNRGMVLLQFLLQMETG